jgi:N-methylhydantoinase A
MPVNAEEQTGPTASTLRIGVDVGGTFTDLVAFDPDTGNLRVVKLASSPPDFHLAVMEAVARAESIARGESSARAEAAASPDTFARPIHLIHGSTVATNALLQRAGEPVAFVTTEGFRDMLLIGRQNRPSLYALHVQRPAPITPEENFFTVAERLDARGRVVQSLTEAEIDRVVAAIRARGLRHAAVCLLFSFVNPIHEKRIGHRFADAGITVSLSSEVLPEFREYERASTTAINASLRPTVQTYLESLSRGLPRRVSELRITQSGGGTLSVEDAARFAAKLVLSGPAGGVMGAAFVARHCGVADVISYDMGGTSTDVATVLQGAPQWTTASTVDGLPIGLPVYDIHTVGAGGGSIASLDAGGALRVGPRSAGAVPGPACYARGGADPTVTDANFLLGRIIPDAFLGGAMRVDLDLARRALEPLAEAMHKTVIEAALGIVRVAEANMTNAVRAVTAQRGHDPRQFALVSFGGAGGLHACALADGLEISRVIVPPYAGVLSALGMVVAPPVVDVARTVVHLAAHLNDAELDAEFARLAQESAEQLPEAQTRRMEYFADVRFRGQSHEMKVEIGAMSLAEISRLFYAAYRRLYGRPPGGRAMEIVTLRVRRTGAAPDVRLPMVKPEFSAGGFVRLATVMDGGGNAVDAAVVRRGELIQMGATPGPLVLLDPEATTFVPAHWLAQADAHGIIELSRLRR